MLRCAVLFSAAVLVCGCQGSGQPLGSMSPFGSQRIPPPGTNAYVKPDINYPAGSNPLGTSGTAAPTLGPTGPTTPSLSTPTGSGVSTPRTSSLFDTPARNATEGVPLGAGQFPIPSGNANEVSGTLASRSNSLFGNSAITPARFDGQPSSAPAVRFGDPQAPTAQSSIRFSGMPVNDATQPARSNVANNAIPEITDLPRAAINSFAANGNAAGSIPPYVPPYAPGSTNPTAGNSGSAGFGWKSKPGATGTTVR